MKVSKLVLLSLLLVLTGIVGLSFALEPLLIPQPFLLKAKLNVDGAVFNGTTNTGKDTTYSIKVKKQSSGVEYTPVDTAGDTFGEAISGRFSYSIPKFDSQDQSGGAVTNDKACVEIYNNTTQLKMTYPAQGGCPANSGEITILNDGEAIGFGGLTGIPNDASHTFATAITVTNPVAAATMTYDSTSVANGGTVAFGAKANGQFSTLTLTLKNTGDTGTTLNITNISEGNDLGNVFSFPTTSLTNIAKDASGTIVITFNLAGKSGSANYTATLNFSANTGAGGASQNYTVNLSGSGQDEATADLNVEIEGGSEAFGTVKVGSSSEKTVTVTSTGTYQLVIGTIAFSGTNADQFSKASDNCSGKTLDPATGTNKTCTFKVVFTPTTAGAKTATGTIPTNKGLTGTGKDNPTDTSSQGAFTGTGAVSNISVAATLVFGDVVVNSTKDSTVTIQNTGGAVLNVSSITAPSGFTVVSPTGAFTVAASGTQTVTIRFSPTSAAAYTGNLTIYSDDPDAATSTVALSGSGVSSGIGVDSSTLDFGSIILPDGPNTTSKNLVVTNLLTDALTSIALSTSAPFSVNPATIATLGAGLSNTVSVTYTGTAGKDAHSGKLTITSGNSSREVTLTGSTNTRPITPVNSTPANAALLLDLVPTLGLTNASAFTDADSDTFAGTQWIIKNVATGSVVFKTQAIQTNGTYADAYDTTNKTSFDVPKGTLQYATQYSFQAVYKDSRGATSTPSTATTFTTPAAPAGVDTYGVPTVVTEVKDSTGATLATVAAVVAAAADTAVKSEIPQIQTISNIVGGTEVIRDENNIAVAVNTADFKFVATNGGATGSPALAVAASGADTIASIQPISATGFTADATGAVVDQAIKNLSTAGISMPYGLFDFSVNVGAGATTKVVIVPPSPFSADTKWYKYDIATNTVKEFPGFIVNATTGYGVLTLTDGGAGDINPVAGIIRDPGGPGAPAGGSTGATSAASGCFIATAAYGSYMHPYVGILKEFRDNVLMPTSIGKAFVAWYYRTSPQVADFIRNSEAMKSLVRLMLLPVVGFGALSLKVGLLAGMLVFGMLFTAGIAVMRRLYNKYSLRK